MAEPRIMRREEIETLRRAEALLAEAKAVLERAQREAEALRVRIVEEAQARARAESARTAAGIVARAEAAASERMNRIEPQLAALVSRTVAEIIGSLDVTEAARLATRTALGRLHDHGRARIHAAPDVAEAVRGAVASMKDPGPEIVDVAIDPALEPGRTIVTSERGSVEIGLAAQIDAALRPWRNGAEDDAA